ncbi:MAG: hypothetical protein GXO79_08855 [Chlorobi bacterium]|nr:hypothetical protein [Chlorobiota bacterium]
MKILLLYATEFGYKTTIKTLLDFPDIEEDKSYKEIQLAFIQVEKEDEENIIPLEKKLIKNLKWIVKKNSTNKIVLHSFAHLSESKADPVVTKEFFNAVEKRLSNSGFEVFQTPFGYFLDLKLEAPGFSTARVFKSI